MTESEYIRKTDDEYTRAEDPIEALLKELIDEVRAQGELNRINNTVLMRRLMAKDSETPAN